MDIRSAGIKVKDRTYTTSGTRLVILLVLLAEGNHLKLIVCSIAFCYEQMYSMRLVAPVQKAQ